jgi:hypothetical protein
MIAKAMVASGEILLLVDPSTRIGTVNGMKRPRSIISVQCKRPASNSRVKLVSERGMSGIDMMILDSMQWQINSMLLCLPRPSPDSQVMS